MYLDRPHFVLERRINQPLPLVNTAVSTGLPFLADSEISLGSHGTLKTDTPLRRTLGSFDMAWRSEARLLAPRGRVVARIQIELDAWSADATRLQIRPVAQHPERWSTRRLRRYFDLAHFAADQTARRIDDLAVTPQLHPLPQLVGATSQ
jgi:hypothetical protein